MQHFMMSDARGSLYMHRWSANCIIGSPRVYPQYGDIHGVWAQSQLDENQFIEVCTLTIQGKLHV